MHLLLNIFFAACPDTAIACKCEMFPMYFYLKIRKQEIWACRKLGDTLAIYLLVDDQVEDLSGKFETVN